MKRIALINDISGLGKCSLTAAIPVVSAMGLQACPLPTAVLSAQTGFDSYFYDDYTDRMNEITDEWAKLNIDFDGICSGYLGNSEQIGNVLYFLEKFKKEDTVFLADPVMGDDGECIKTFSGELLKTMKELSRRADVVTPNLTELCLLADMDYSKLASNRNRADYIDRVADVAQGLLQKSLTRQTVIVTGIIRAEEERHLIGNLVVSDSEVSCCESEYTGKSFSGTGDLFSSVVIGALVKGMSARAAVKLAVDFLQPAIEEASLNNIPSVHGVYFEKYLSKLIGV